MKPRPKLKLMEILIGQPPKLMLLLKLNKNRDAKFISMILVDRFGWMNASKVS